MNGLTEHLELLNTIEKYFKICKTASIKGINDLDVSETKGMILLKFGCPDEYFPEYSFILGVIPERRKRLSSWEIANSNMHTISK